MIGVRRYSGPNRSGICKCGHSWRDHHLGVVMNVEHYEATGESYVPQECEFFGCNEMGGLDRDGNDHCGHYVDMMEEKEMNWFTKLFRKTFATVKAEGSAAYRVATHETKVIEAKGVIIALKAAEKVSHAALDELEAAAAEIHKGRDAIQARIETLRGTLGF